MQTTSAACAFCHIESLNGHDYFIRKLLKLEDHEVGGLVLEDHEVGGLLLKLDDHEVAGLLLKLEDHAVGRLVLEEQDRLGTASAAGQFAPQRFLIRAPMLNCFYITQTDFRICLSRSGIAQRHEKIA